jgi:CRISPR/Cas system-associated endonuclease Cas3-HD
MKKKQIQATTKKEGGKLIAIASTETEDRVGDKLLMKDWDLSKFKANPVLQAGHDYRPEFTIGVAKNIKVDGKQLTFEPVFHDLTQLARDIKAMYQEGVLKAWSVGFIPKEFKEGDDAKNELLEVSAVAVPANAECLTLAKSYGQKEATKVKEWVETTTDKKENKVNEEVIETIVDELDEQEAKKQKWANLDKVDNIMYAFYKVYMQKEVPVEDFSKLLEESIKLLQNLTGSNEKEFVSELLTDFNGSMKDILFKQDKEATEKSPACRQDDESKDECVSRKIPELIDEGKEIDLKKADELVEKFMKAVEDLNKCVSQIKDTTVALEKVAKIEQPQEQKVKGNGNSKGRTVKEVKGQKALDADAVVLRALQKIAGNANKALSIKKNNGK